MPRPLVDQRPSSAPNRSFCKAVGSGGFGQDAVELNRIPSRKFLPGKSETDIIYVRCGALGTSGRLEKAIDDYDQFEPASHPSPITPDTEPSGTGIIHPRRASP